MYVVCINKSKIQSTFIIYHQYYVNACPTWLCSLLVGQIKPLSPIFSVLLDPSHLATGNLPRTLSPAFLKPTTKFSETGTLASKKKPPTKRDDWEKRKGMKVAIGRWFFYVSGMGCRVVAVSEKGLSLVYCAVLDDTPSIDLMVSHPSHLSLDFSLILYLSFFHFICIRAIIHRWASSIHEFMALSLGSFDHGTGDRLHACIHIGTPPSMDPVDLPVPCNWCLSRGLSDIMSRAEGLKSLGIRMRVNMKVNKRGRDALAISFSSVNWTCTCAVCFDPTSSPPIRTISFTVAQYSRVRPDWQAAKGYGWRFSTYNSFYSWPFASSGGMPGRKPITSWRRPTTPLLSCWFSGSWRFYFCSPSLLALRLQVDIIIVIIILPSRL